MEAVAYLGTELAREQADGPIRMALARKAASDGFGQPGIRATMAYRIPASGAGGAPEECWVVEEQALSIDIEGVGSYTLMWTPTEHPEPAAGYVDSEGILGANADPEALALAAGFAFSEGIIRGLEDVRTMAVCSEHPGVVRMSLVDPAKAKVRRRDVVLSSSCGICSSREVLDHTLAGLPEVSDSLRIAATHFMPLMQAMRRRQGVFLTTGGAHAAAIFSSDGRVLCVAEDLGRHNALDKVIGRCLLRKWPMAGKGVVLSSRVTLEMVSKAARAGLEIVAAVSAPSSLAIEMADRCGITLCGFVRGASATIYSHPGRVQTSGARWSAA